MTSEYDHDRKSIRHLDNSLAILGRYAIELGTNGLTGDATCTLWIAPAESGLEEIAYITTNGDPVVIAYREIGSEDDMSIVADDVPVWAAELLDDACLVEI